MRIQHLRCKNILCAQYSFVRDSLVLTYIWVTHQEAGNVRICSNSTFNVMNDIINIDLESVNVNSISFALTMTNCKYIIYCAIKLVYAQTTSSTELQLCLGIVLRVILGSWTLTTLNEMLSMHACVIVVWKYACKPLKEMEIIGLVSEKERGIEQR